VKISVETGGSMISKSMLIAIMPLALLCACGDKVPESQAAKQVGAAPKQTVDKAAADVTKAIDQGADRAKQADDTK